MQAVVPPVENRISQSMKFLERAKKRLARSFNRQFRRNPIAEEVAEAEARMREEVPVPTVPDEDAQAEVQHL